MIVHRRTVPLDMMVTESRGRVISIITHGNKIIISTRTYDGDAINRGMSVRLSFDKLYDYLNYHSNSMSIWSAVHSKSKVVK